MEYPQEGTERLTLTEGEFCGLCSSEDHFEAPDDHCFMALGVEEQAHQDLLVETVRQVNELVAKQTATSNFAKCGYWFGFLFAIFLAGFSFLIPSPAGKYSCKPCEGDGVSNSTGCTYFPAQRNYCCAGEYVLVQNDNTIEYLYKYESQSACQVAGTAADAENSGGTTALIVCLVGFCLFLGFTLFPVLFRIWKRRNLVKYTSETLPPKLIPYNKKLAPHSLKLDISSLNGQPELVLTSSRTPTNHFVNSNDSLTPKVTVTHQAPASPVVSQSPSHSNTASLEIELTAEKATPLACPVPTGKRFHVFLTHDWGMDEMGRNNHESVTVVNKALQARGIRTWFDADRMEGQILDQMCRGIDESALALVFITRRYMEKVYGTNENDNCKIEFNYIKETLSSQSMLAIPMEPKCLDPKQWIGSVRAVLGSRLYTSNFAFNLETEPAKFNENIDKIVKFVVK